MRERGRQRRENGDKRERERKRGEKESGEKERENKGGRDRRREERKRAIDEWWPVIEIRRKFRNVGFSGVCDDIMSGGNEDLG